MFVLYGKRRLIPLVLLIAALALALPAAAQDEAIALVPHADEAFGIQGVIPEGWTQVGPGLFAPAGQAGDPTLLAQQAAPVPVATVWPSLLPQLQLDAIPESTGTYQGGAFEWTLYQVDVSAGGLDVRVDVAMAEQGGSTYIALLQTTPEDYEALHTGVFLPVLDAFALIEATPATDLPYTAEEVTFANGEITLAGTLTMPEGAGPYPVVVLISGSGPQDRDESLPGIPIKPFALIADHLTRAGLAVLRYDDRGTAQSTGDFASATSVDFASDATAAIDYLKTRPEIDPAQIGVLGHSEGGLIAAYLGARNPDIAFIISMAGTAVSGGDVLLLQNERILETAGADAATVQAQISFLEAAYPLVTAEDTEGLIAVAREYGAQLWALLPEDQRGTDQAAFIEQTVTGTLDFFDNPWARFFLTYDPGEDWAAVTVPVLGIFGELDVQVVPSQNAPALEAALEAAGNADFTIVTLPQTNHLFQTAESGGTDEYATLGAEFDPAFLPLITEWLLERVTLP